MTTRAEALAAYGELAAEHQIACEAMTPREQAEAAHRPGHPLTLDELEARIREERGLPPARQAS